MRVKGKEIGSGKPCICVPVMEEKKEQVIKEIIAVAESAADMIEWRVDAFEAFRDNNTMREIFEAVAPYLKEKIFLYTFRSAKQGGLAEITEDELIDLQDLAMESKCVDFVDFEFFAVDKPEKYIQRLHKGGVKVIASHHDFTTTPNGDVMTMLLEKMSMGGADIVKLAVMPEKVDDVLVLLGVTSDFRYENPNTPIISMSMGKLGVISRLSGETFGSCVTFAARKKASAPGQMKLEDVAEILNMIHQS